MHGALALFGPAPKPKIVMINPAGHARQTGRKLPNSHERAVSYKLAEALGRAIENRYGMRAVLTRTPGEALVHLQSASFANRLNVDFFININIYKEDHEKPKVYLMHRMIDPFADLARRSYPPLEFTPVSHAHMRNIHKTKSFGERIKMVLTQPEYQKLFDFSGVQGLPLKPLEGVTAPAVLFDIGINDEAKLAQLVEPLAASMKFLLEY